MSAATGPTNAPPAWPAACTKAENGLEISQGARDTPCAALDPRFSVPGRPTGPDRARGCRWASPPSRAAGVGVAGWKREIVAQSAVVAAGGRTVTRCRTVTRRRTAAAVLLVIVVATGLVVHGVLPESPFADIAGDALYVGAAYLALVVAMPRPRPWIVGSVALVWCMGVELLQLTDLPQQAGVIFPPAVLLLGATFDGRDLLVYVATAVVLTAIDEARARRTKVADARLGRATRT